MNSLIVIDGVKLILEPGFTLQHCPEIKFLQVNNTNFNFLNDIKNNFYFL